MLQAEQVQTLGGGLGSGDIATGGGPEMRLYTRYEHGNLPVRVFRGEDGETRYEVMQRGGGSVVYESARKMISAFYGHDVHMPFDRYFRLGRYRVGKQSGRANILTLLDTNQGSTAKTPIAVHSKGVFSSRKTGISVLGEEKSALKESDEVVSEFIKELEADLAPEDAFIEPTEEMKREFDKAFELELDRLEGVVGISLGEKSDRRGATYRADEVRKLLWRGFAGKMLSQGYDPEEVLQEVYRGLLVRNRGKCPWDARKSTFGHYVYLVIGCVLTNYHRKQTRRVDRDAISLTVTNKDGEELVDIGKFGSCRIHEGSELGDMLALDGLAAYLEGLPESSPEAELGREILPLVASGHQRRDIVKETGHKPGLVSRALAWLRRQTALWATECGMGYRVPSKYLSGD